MYYPRGYVNNAHRHTPTSSLHIILRFICTYFILSIYMYVFLPKKGPYQSNLTTIVRHKLFRVPIPDQKHYISRGHRAAGTCIFARSDLLPCRDIEGQNQCSGRSAPESVRIPARPQNRYLSVFTATLIATGLISSTAGLQSIILPIYRSSSRSERAHPQVHCYMSSYDVMLWIGSRYTRTRILSNSAQSSSSERGHILKSKNNFNWTEL